jgi:hypothetical protein
MRCVLQSLPKGDAGAMVKIRLPLSLWLDVPDAFDALEAFLREMDSAAEKSIAKQQERADAEPYDPEEGPGIESYRATILQETLPRTVRYSAVLYAHAALDTLLSKLCDHARERLGLRFSRSDMKNAREIRTRLQYLRKAFGDDLAPDAFGGPFGQKLEDFSTIRHCIAHANGEIDVGGPDRAKKVREAAGRLGFPSRGSHLNIPVGAIANLIHEARAWAEAACGAVQTAVVAVKERASN